MTDYSPTVGALQFMAALGYTYEKPHPADCECQEFNSDTTKHGYWKDGDFILAETVDKALEEYTR